METYVRNINDSVNITTTEVYMLTSEVSITEEENAIVTLVIIVIGIIIAIMVLFSMGIFIDCKHQKKDSMKKRKLKLNMPSLERKKRKDEVKTLASNMCPTASDIGFSVSDAIV